MRVSGPVLEVTEAMTLDNARALLDQGCSAVADGVRQVDLSAVPSLDSSALTVIFAWHRAAERAGGTLSLTAIPEDLDSLARLYGVTALLRNGGAAPAA